MKRGLTYGLVLVVGLGLIGGGSIMHHSNVVEAKEKAQQAEQRYVQANKAVKALYADLAQTMPASLISQNQVKQTKQVIQRVSDKNKRHKLMTARHGALTMDTARKAVNGLIAHHVLNSHATLAQIGDVQKDIEPVKNISAPFYHTLQTSIDESLQQYNHIQKVKTDLKASQATTNTKVYQNLVAEVKAIPNADVQKNLMATCDSIKTSIAQHKKAIEHAVNGSKQTGSSSHSVTHNNAVASSSQSSGGVATSHSSVSHSDGVAVNHSVSQSSVTSSSKKSSSSSSSQSNSSTASHSSSSVGHQASQPSKSSSSSNHWTSTWHQDGGGSINNSTGSYVTGTFPIPTGR